MSDRCWATSPTGGYLCELEPGHEGDHSTTFVGGSEEWEEGEGGRSPAADWTREERLSPPHECEVVADYGRFMTGPRRFWVGKITEPPPGFDHEMYCLHVETATKPEVVFCLNEWDLHYLRSAIYALIETHGNSTWDERIASSAEVE